MTSAEVVETLVIVNNNSYFLNYNVDLLYRPKEENKTKSYPLRKVNCITAAKKSLTV